MSQQPAAQANNPFQSRASLAIPGGLRDTVTIYRLDALDKAGVAATAKLPVTIKVLLEAALRNCDGFAVTEEHITTLANWTPEAAKQGIEIPFVPARVILQDFTGVPAVVDLAALRATMKRLGGDPNRINPQVPADLVIDHSVQVDAFGSAAALHLNSEREFERNRERYEFLRWGQNAFDNFSVVPPESGIVHQVNLEYLATVVATREQNGELVAFPDSLVGTDSHTTMINGIGVLGWGVGGIEAEAAMLGQPIFMLMPEVVGVKLEGELPQGSTATDLVLAVTQMLRTHGVVGKFVEFCGEGLPRLSLADRATIANMAPEYGATCGFFPVDDETLNYMRNTARDEALVKTVEAYAKEQGLWHSDTLPQYTDLLTLDMSEVEPSLAGPKRPQDRISLAAMKAQWSDDLSTTFNKAPRINDSTPDRFAAEGGQASIEMQTATATAEGSAEVEYNGQRFMLNHGAVVIAAITSCTNTSNPSVMLGAGLLAKKAVEAGLVTKPWVKTSLAPGSKVVTEYLKASGLLPYLEKLGFYLVGYGCTTCIGNSGPLPEEIASAIDAADLVAASVLSGNRNFEGRINPHVRANYLASPPLVVAYALAGTVELDLATEPIGAGEGGKPVYLKDIWPSQEEIKRTVTETLKPEMFREQYAHIFDGPELWQSIQGVEGELYDFEDSSTYIQEPPFFTSLTLDVPPVEPVRGGRVLALLGDSITTDHISPAGAIPPTSPAGKYLIDKGVQPRDFNSYGSRRGNHEVMMRGTFANIRIKNHLAPGTEGGVTRHFPSGEQMSIYDAAMRYQTENVPLVVLAGSEYGTGSSRDWAAKGTYLLGVKAVIAGSYERIHRSNLVFMGVLPLEFADGATWKTLGLTGDETYDIELPAKVEPRQRYTVKATKPQGATIEFTAQSRLDSAVEVRYWQQGGILHTVLRDMLQAT